MQILKNETRIDFLGYRRIAFAISAVLLLISFAALGLRGLNYGLDFTGGTVIEVGYPDAANLEAVRSAMADNGYPDAVVQHFGSSQDVLIRLPPSEQPSAKLSNQILEILRQDSEGVEMRRVEFVGPQVGDELKEKGGMAMIWALAGILVYVAFRFEYRFALGSVAAIVHDVVITLGVFAITQITFDLTVLAALLAVIGYSLNDTIVVFDRIRENFVLVRKGSPTETTNLSVNQMLGRTIVTSGTTLIVVLALLLVGGELIYGFATALLVGVIVGTYSSIFVASAVVLAMGVSKEDLVPPEKEGEDAEEEERP
jgi:preprotein translocase subunit SecF